MQEYKELHVATSLGALDTLVVSSSNSHLKTKNPGMLLNIARKLYGTFENDPFDQEASYIVMRRFLLVYDLLMKSHPDANYVEIMLGKEVSRANSLLSDLRVSLKERYQELKLKELVKSTQTVKLPKRAKWKNIFCDQTFISCQDLFRALNNGVNLLILDARSPEDFTASHIISDSCINVPDDSIQDGLSANTLGTVLPKESLPYWDKRDTYDAIVLVDWDTTNTNYYMSKLHKLRTVITLWDIERVYKVKPVCLNYGFLEWLEMYPTYCTVSTVIYAKANHNLDDLLYLDTIEYPADHEPKIQPVLQPDKVIETQAGIDKIPSRDDIIVKSQDLIKQLNSVCGEILKYEKEMEDTRKKIKLELDKIKLDVLKKNVTNIEEKLRSLTEKESELMDVKNKLAENFDLAASFTPGLEIEDTKLDEIDKLQQDHLDLTRAREALATDRQSFLDDARLSKKPLVSPIKPDVNRSTKPKENLIGKSLSFRIEGNIKSVKCGLTGLANIKNTCYMNAVIQCFRHIPVVSHYYCEGVYSKEFTGDPLLSNETAHLIRALWSNTHKFIRPTEFYRKFVSLRRNYGTGDHEDCMEFFLALFNYLSEDCSSSVTYRTYWSDSQRSWWKQLAGMTSFFINNFYHQMKVEIFCNSCEKSPNVRYDAENIVYLHLPNKSTFNLDNCLNDYLKSKENILCTKCNNSKVVNKSINYYPTVLIIALKRHIPEFSSGRVRYIKNISHCIFSYFDITFGNVKYNLRSIALHSGSVNSGHYTAVCVNPIDKQWYTYNDDSVTPLGPDDQTVGAKAYAFFYSIDESSTNAASVSDKFLE